MKTINFSIEVDDSVHLSEVHKWHSDVISEAVRLFAAKNHDYCSSWRILDPKCITKRILVRCVRLLKLLKLEEEGREGLICEGVESEFVDICNDSVFGCLLHRGYGLDLLEALADEGVEINDFEDPMEQEDPEEFFEQLPVATQVEAILSEAVNAAASKGKVIAPKQPSIEAIKAVEEITKHQLEETNPFPMLLLLDENNAATELSSFRLGNSPYIYLRSDEIYPEEVEAFKKRMPGKELYVRTSEQEGSLNNQDHVAAIVNEAPSKRKRTKKLVAEKQLSIAESNNIASLAKILGEAI